MPNRLYGLSYTLPGIGNGLTSLTFPMRIDQAQQRVGDDDAGNYYAMQLDVNDLNGKHLGTAYTGLQPRQDGKALMTFSGFNQHFSAPDGKSGADGGPGASNSALIDFQFGHKYALTIERDPNHHSLLKAFVQDVTDPARPGPRQHVKNLQLDQDVLLAPNSGGGFIEHYGKSISKSSQIAPTRGTFYAPFGTTALGKTIHGSLTPGDLSGRFSQSTTGERTIVKTAGRISEVSVSVRGAK